MHKSATKCNETQGKWCKNKHGASKIIDTLETYQTAVSDITKSERVPNMLVLATKEDMREFSEDPTAMPLVLMYNGEILVSNDRQPISLHVSTVLQDFDNVFPEASSTRST
jgi:hypothetical protein